MLITYFIGNGFDLNNDLQTKFSDFYDHIKSTHPISTIQNNDIYSEVERDADKWSYFEMELGHLTHKYSQKTKKKLLSDIDEFRSHFIDYMTMQNKAFSFNKSKVREILTHSLINSSFAVKK